MFFSRNSNYLRCLRTHSKIKCNCLAKRNFWKLMCRIHFCCKLVINESLMMMYHGLNRYFTILIPCSNESVSFVPKWDPFNECKKRFTYSCTQIGLNPNYLLRPIWVQKRFTYSCTHQKNIYWGHRKMIGQFGYKNRFPFKQM